MTADTGSYPVRRKQYSRSNYRAKGNGLTEQVRADVAIVEDDADQCALLTRVLERAGFSVVTATSVEGGEALVKNDAPKILLCDFDLPDGTGVDLCTSVRKFSDRSSCYLMLMSSSTCCDLPTEVLNAGADDYLAKPVPHQELISRVRVGMRMSCMHEQLRAAAVTDGLTGLYNHDHFNRLLEREMERSRRYGNPLALIMLDMDHFKAINDAYGHLAGNATLEAVAKVIREGIREIDIPARFGGEEFTIILPEARAVDGIQVAERIRILLSRSLRVEAIRDYPVTASFGISDSDDPRVISSADLVDLADRALYAAKRQGRDQVSCSYELDEMADVTATIQSDEIDWLRRRLTALSVRAKDVYMQSVAALLQALDEKDPFTARHSINVAYYAQQLAEQMGCSQATIKSVYNAALLHDIGKVGVPDRILMKRQPLTDVERMVLDQVPIIGTRIVDHLRILESELLIIRHQHEHFDGRGVPSGLKGTKIPIGARILLVADAFDAMTTDRVYRKRRAIDDVVEELHRLAGKQFDPRVVTAHRQCLAEYRADWEQRIDETVRELQGPSGSQLANELIQ